MVAVDPQPESLTSDGLTEAELAQLSQRHVDDAEGRSLGLDFISSLGADGSSVAGNLFGDSDNSLDDLDLALAQVDGVRTADLDAAGTRGRRATQQDDRDIDGLGALIAGRTNVTVLADMTPIGILEPGDWLEEDTIVDAGSIAGR